MCSNCPLDWAMLASALAERHGAQSCHHPPLPWQQASSAYNARHSLRPEHHSYSQASTSLTSRRPYLQTSASPIYYNTTTSPVSPHSSHRSQHSASWSPPAIPRAVSTVTPSNSKYGRPSFPSSSYDFSNSTRAPSTVGQKGTTALHLAAKNGRVDVVQTLLQLKLEVDVQDAQGSTALHVAAAKGYEEIVRTLLASSADIEVEDHEGFTALQLAAMNGHANVVQLLVNGGAAVN